MHEQSRCRRQLIPAIGLAAMASVFAGRLPAAEPLDFAHDIVPVLRKACGQCHLGEKHEGGLSLNTRNSLLKGGESGPAAVSGKSSASELVRRVRSTDETEMMPPKGNRLTASQVDLLARWIDGGIAWQEGFSFRASDYEPPLAPRRPELPPVQNGRDHPLDRIVDAYLGKHGLSRPEPIDDPQFLRRATLDLTGLLPTPERLAAFVADRSPDKRERLVRELLADDVAYAEHWLTFWNDLLRNDYTGTGFITGGRKQITKWLYEALVTNKPYDQLARELIAPPTPESEGFIQGIRWRGEVSAGQTVEIQFAQSIGQSLLGINLKCASCHDSFIDRWKLDEAFGLAAVYATQPLPIHRCDKPVGRNAQAAWLFPELGRIDPAAPQPERLKQLAALMTHRENGRFTRTIVNRLWQRMLGRGIVHPVDAMQSEPFSADLLDYLAVHLSDNGYDLKKTLELIATSEIYQARAAAVAERIEGDGYVFAGPRAKRLTAEQFVDAVWQLTDTAPARLDAPVLRGKPNSAGAAQQALQAKWIWSRADSQSAAAGETATFRRQFTLQQQPKQAVAVATCDNEYTLYVNGVKVHASDNWQAPEAIPLTDRLQAGKNEFLIVARNAGASPNPAGLLFEVRVTLPDESTNVLGTDETWQWTSKLPNAKGRFATPPDDWQGAALVGKPEVWDAQLAGTLPDLFARAAGAQGLMVRASLVKSDFLMRSLGRPNRDQIVTVRPEELTTLEAIDLSNGQILAETLQRGANHLLARNWKSSDEFIHWLYQHALSREPTADELQTLGAALGPQLTEQGVEDVLWSVLMLPEFQLVR
jgi:hypothetical protein